ncbi:MAG TPA: DEAD/DEAH box helicase [Chthoniobacteraceae bacterium]|jgi:ATP-dependent RNA helicase RhlE|nr:DEAD/DEAH box helicase [Chthoniobacteraceae bacterium]
MPFDLLGLGDPILRAIQEAGYTEPTPIQAAAIPRVLAGQDLMGIAQTGTGKTAAFTLPMLARLAGMTGEGRRQTRALVLAPTRELVVQIEENVRAYAKHLPLRMATVFGGVGERPQMQALRTGADIVIATPGRLLDLMGRGCADFGGLKFLVLDEADRMLDMGFIPDIKRIVRGLPQKRQTLLFSATLSKEIEGLTQEFLHDPKLVQIGRRSNPADTVTQIVYEIPHGEKPALLAHLLQDPAMNTVLVFSRTKHGADRIARQCEARGITTATLHSNRSQNQRLRALRDFKSGAVRVLVATDIAARGIDVDGISHVVNYDFPAHPEDYVHRIGRTGRAHAVGDAISFVTPEDRGSLRMLERFIGRGLTRRHPEGFVAPPPAPREPRPAYNKESRPTAQAQRPSQPGRGPRKPGSPGTEQRQRPSHGTDQPPGSNRRGGGWRRRR